MNTTSPNSFLLLFLITAMFLSACRQSSGDLPYSVTQSLVSDSAMVVSAHPLASAAGVEILKKGGNAVDAAIAVQFVLAVVYPRAGNIGGGGFMLFRQRDGSLAGLDYREKAPQGASRDMFLDSLGAPVERLSTYGHLACGVPGTVKGLEEAHQKFGSLPWKDLLESAIKLAAEGFPITQTEADRLNTYREDFLKYNTTKPVFVKNSTWKKGDLLVQKDLAATLKNIRDNGSRGFYEGAVAEKIVAEMKAGGGLITFEDLKSYEAKWRTPLSEKYKNYRVISMPPSSSGGVALLQLMAVSEQFSFDSLPFHQAGTVHLMSEAMRRVYADRAEYLGDSDFYEVPVEKLLDSFYLLERMRDFNARKASPSESVFAGNINVQLESFETTHTSVVDSEGNAVSVTTTLNSNYGNKVMVSGGGFFLNNEMDDFSIKPGEPNQFGLVGKEANAIQPGKRMLSSMTPTIVEKDGRLFMVLGTPGGSTIISSVYQVIMNVVEFGMSLDAAVAAPRFHHQWLPDEIWMEPNTFDSLTIQSLRQMGHQLKEQERIAKVKAILILPDGRLHGVGDPRMGEDDAEGY